MLTGEIQTDSHIFKQLSQKLYDYLIAPSEHLFKDKTALVIIPDGILGFLPFETLMDKEGRYLAEKYRITYIQSLKIFDLVNQRHYSSNRKPMLAIGAAVYDPITYDGDMIQSRQQLALLNKNINNTISRGGSLRNNYGALNLQWDNLPGTLSEIKAISKIIPNAQMISGRQVTEEQIKKLSDADQLKQYKVIHFAIHGITIPEAPQLTAVVLSQFKNNGKEDGYLRMHEISKLKFNADFINLSACETGLGKIYKGEGVVGLMHAFMIAGANSLSTSLWKVDDKATSLFMKNLYKLVVTKRMSYGDAMTAVKRKFIRGDFGEKYKDPYFWSAFVYYGAL